MGMLWIPFEQAIRYITLARNNSNSDQILHLPLAQGDRNFTMCCIRPAKSKAIECHKSPIWWPINSNGAVWPKKDYIYDKFYFR